MEEMNNVSTEKKNEFSMPMFKNLNWDLTIAILGLVIVLLPSILLKLLSFDPEAMLTPDSILVQPSFNGITVLLGLIFSIYSLVKAKDNYAIKTIALITLIVSVIRLMFQ